MPEPELKLNSLARFSKTSPALVLEEYSSCEVPAGCGGVVLRWCNPNEPIPMAIRTGYGNGRREILALDGKTEINDSRMPVRYGRHALAFVLREVDPNFACLLLAAQLDPDYVRILQPEGDTFLLSQSDGTWKYNTDTPQGEEWMQAEFDDSGWRTMTAKPQMESPYGSHWSEEILTQGAEPLGIDLDSSAPQKTNVYIRKTFTVRQGREE